VLKLIALVIPLGLDTFAIAAALGIAGLPRNQRLRISALFMAFEGGMPLVDLLVGQLVSVVIGKYADFAAAAVLVVLGAFMLLSRDEDEDEKAQLLLRTRGLAVLGLGVSISLDELAIGFTLGLIKVAVPIAIALIAAQAFVMAQLGFRLGGRIGESFREGTERVAGGVLVLLGLGIGVARLTGVSL
jgi:putative Mn2+ efflux pump MntP